MLVEQELQDRYGLSSENLRWVKSTFIKLIRHFLKTSQIDIELKASPETAPATSLSEFKIEKLSLQTEIQARLERLWEEICLELITHPQEYCLMDTAPLDSYVRNFAWGLDAIIKARLEINFRLESQELQTEELSCDCTKATPAMTGRFDFVDRKEEKLERLVPFFQIGSKTSFSWLKTSAAIIAGSLLSFALLVGLGLIHAERISTQTQASPHTHSIQNSAHT